VCNDKENNVALHFFLLFPYFSCHSRERGNPDFKIQIPKVKIPHQVRNDSKNRMLKSRFRVKHGMTEIGNAE